MSKRAFLVSLSTVAAVGTGFYIARYVPPTEDRIPNGSEGSTSAFSSTIEAPLQSSGDHVVDMSPGVTYPRGLAPDYDSTGAAWIKLKSLTGAELVRVSGEEFNAGHAREARASLEQEIGRGSVSFPVFEAAMVMNSDIGYFRWLIDSYARNAIESDKTLDRNSQRISMGTDLVETVIKGRDFDLATMLVDDLSQEFPQDVSVGVEVARVRGLKGDHEGAVDSLQRLLSSADSKDNGSQSNDTIASAYLEWVTQLLAAKRIDEAARMAALVKSRFPTHARAASSLLGE